MNGMHRVESDNSVDADEPIMKHMMEGGVTILKQLERKKQVCYRSVDQTLVWRANEWIGPVSPNDKFRPLDIKGNSICYSLNLKIHFKNSLKKIVKRQK